jgi:putative DNA primase/helicase
MLIFSTSNEAAKINTPIQIPTETEPKPNHFRGETMEQLRPDDLKDAISEKKIFCGNPIPITERARGYWSTILPALGIDPRFLTAKNGPCPMCGGKDRFRYTDLESRGTWWCNNCDDANGRNGYALALRFTGMPYAELSKRIAEIIDGRPPRLLRQNGPRSPDRAALNALWRNGRPIEPDDPVDRWMIGRKIILRDYPKCLRFIRQLKHRGPPETIHPAMLAMVSDTDGMPSTIHKTYLTFDGQKADVARVRRFSEGPRPEGGAVRLAAHGAELGIAEGIETALAASQLHGVPVWAALDALGVERFIPPPEITKLIIFGDNDANHRGQSAAYGLACRLLHRQGIKIEVEVKIPDRVGADWNDVLRGVQP